MPFHIERIESIIKAANTISNEFFLFRNDIAEIVGQWRRSEDLSLQAAAVALDNLVNLNVLPFEVSAAREIIQTELAISRVLRARRGRNKNAKRLKLGLPVEAQGFSLAEIERKLNSPKVRQILASQASQADSQAEPPRQLEPGEISWSTDGYNKIDLSNGDPTLAEDNDDPNWDPDPDSDSNLIPNSSNSP